MQLPLFPGHFFPCHINGTCHRSKMPLSHAFYHLCDKALLVPEIYDWICAHYVIGSVSHIMVRQKSLCDKAEGQGDLGDY